MSERTIKLLLIDRDPIFRTGLRIVVEQFPDIQVAAEAETDAAQERILAELAELATDSTSSTSASKVDLVVLDLMFSQVGSSAVGLKLCRQLKTQYPNLPVLLLTYLQEPTQLAAARQAGVDGYCPKGTSVSELIAAIRQVAAGRSYWREEGRAGRRDELGGGTKERLTWSRGAEGQRDRADASPAARRQDACATPTSGIVARIRNHLHLSGLRQIDATLAEVTAELQVPGTPLLDRAILAGHRRELLAARWLVNQLLGAGTSRDELGAKEQVGRRAGGQVSGSPAHPLTRSQNASPSPHLPISPSLDLSISPTPSSLFESTRAKLQSSLDNLSGVPLEMDILREEKKRELFYLILRKIEEVLNDLRYSQIQLSQLPEMHSAIMRDLWQAATTDFFGRYSTLRVGDRNLEIVNLLLQDTRVVQTAILDKIPLVVELFSYLLFQTPVVVDNVPYQAGSPEAMERAEAILHNLLIQIANGVVQPLLNHLADLEVIKQSLYDRRLISTRDIERFRNNLSWKYRLGYYIVEPTAIFESRYDLLVLASRGIAKISIYAPRVQELAQLEGVRYSVTLALETRDAIAPRIRAAVAFLGSGVVYVLTQVVGRAIGLIGRGILQGLGRGARG